ncbi:MAG: hypothetical protein L0214_10955 [candidate division NC10 bacterium]|nr:hypothetical protein [candidate division NC10 bacterium]
MLPTWLAFPLHPPLVHFALAAAVGASLFEGLGLILKRPRLRQTGGHLLHLVPILLAGTIAAGLYDADPVPLTGQVGALIVLHRNLAFGAGAAYLVAWVLRRVEDRRFAGRGAPRPFVMAYGLILLIGLGLILVTGYYGSELVFKQGVNVG